MTLQTSGAISLANIQTEFGGANPISINEYYRGGVYVANTTATANIPVSGGISFSNFYGASAVTQSLIWSSFETSENAPSTTAVLTIKNDGTITGPFGSPTKWLNITPDTTSAALYEIRWTASGGILTKSTSLVQNTWYALSTGRSFTISGNQGASDRLGTFTIAIRLASAGGNGTSAIWTHRLIGNG